MCKERELLIGTFAYEFDKVPPYFPDKAPVHRVAQTDVELLPRCPRYRSKSNATRASNDPSGIGAHTDYKILTLLLPTAPGLEVMNSAGRWIDAPPLPGALGVNIGDVLEVIQRGIHGHLAPRAPATTG
jgi:isopenicillin N synthase-like dioxygenase